MLRKDHFEHLLIGLGIQIVFWCICLVLGIPFGAVIGGLVSGSVFYGREQRDNEIKICAELKCNLEHIKYMWRTYLPWLFSRDGRWDLFVPVIGNVVLALISFLF